MRSCAGGMHGGRDIICQPRSGRSTVRFPEICWERLPRMLQGGPIPLLLKVETGLHAHRLAHPALLFSLQPSKPSMHARLLVKHLEMMLYTTFKSPDHPC